MTPSEKRAAFRALHVPGDPLIMPNPWDVGSTKVMTSLGAKALATTSAGHAFTIGKPDQGFVTAAEAFAHAAEVVAATDLPVNADFENGYGPAPEDAAGTVRRAAEIGLAGCSIEDADLQGEGSYGFDDAMARAHACIAAAKESGIVLTLRADGYMNRHYDAEEALRRMRAFAEAGADVIYAPLVKDDVLKAMAETGTPVNALMTARDAGRPASDFAALGLARLSIGSTIARVTHQAMLDASRGAIVGDFSTFTNAASGDEVDALLT
ncbi:MAG: isocitrate lyase/phosphoenolpyruvate mutase family protein [Pseudomonadota bacterium]